DVPWQVSPARVSSEKRDVASHVSTTAAPADRLKCFRMVTTPTALPATHRKQLRVIGVPLDLGAARRGVDMGPSAVRVAGLEARLEAIGHFVEDAGNVPVAIAEQKKEGSPHAKYLEEITATCTKHAELVVKTLESGIVPVVLGGDHSVGAGTVAGVSEFYRRQGQRSGRIWID